MREVGDGDCIQHHHKLLLNCYRSSSIPYTSIDASEGDLAETVSAKICTLILILSTGTFAGGLYT